MEPTGFEEESGLYVPSAFLCSIMSSQISNAMAKIWYARIKIPKYALENGVIYDQIGRVQKLR